MTTFNILYEKDRPPDLTVTDKARRYYHDTLPSIFLEAGGLCFLLLGRRSTAGGWKTHEDLERVVAEKKSVCLPLFIALEG
jgi:hypothetical protein